MRARAPPNTPQTLRRGADGVRDGSPRGDRLPTQATHGRSRPSALAQRRSARAACVSPGSARAPFAFGPRALALSPRSRSPLAAKPSLLFSPRGAHLLLRLLVLVALPREAHAHAERHMPRPSTTGTCSASCQADVLRLHHLLRKLLNLAHGARRLVLNVRPCSRLLGSRCTRAHQVGHCPLLVALDHLARWAPHSGEMASRKSHTFACLLKYTNPVHGTHHHNSSPLARAPRREI